VPVTECSEGTGTTRPAERQALLLLALGFYYSLHYTNRSLNFHFILARYPHSMSISPNTTGNNIYSYLELEFTPIGISLPLLCGTKIVQLDLLPLTLIQSRNPSLSATILGHTSQMYLSTSSPVASHPVKLYAERDG
jgi:hypothetical protein